MNKTAKRIIKTKINIKFKKKKIRLFKKKNQSKILLLLITPYKFYLIIINIIIAILLIFKSINNNKNININQKIVIKTDKKYCYETFEEVAAKSKEFYKLINDGILIGDIPKKVSYNPKLSVIVPVYSAEKYIKRTVRSAQNQNFTDIEIILVDDLSTDNSLKIIEEMSNEDPRIKIIKNKENKGILYSRCIGVLMSNGKNILPLDDDDFYINSEFFYILNKEIDKMDVDLINFRVFFTHNQKDPVNAHYIVWKPTEFTENNVLFQPELGKFGDGKCHIWEHCIKSKFYKKAIDLYGKDRINNFITLSEDCIMHHIFYQTATSLKQFLKIGIVHIERPDSTCRIQNKINVTKYKMFLFESYFDFSKFTKITRNSTVYNIINLMKKEEFQKLMKDIKIKKYFNAFIKRIISNNDITKETKKALIQVCIQNNLTR